ncbi:MAG: SIS domain-containing protein [Bacteroidota bacterium]
MDERIKEVLTENIMLRQALLENEPLLTHIDKIADLTTIALKGGKKVLFCGSGDSAVDAYHLAGELSGRYYKDRPPLFAESLHMDISALTAASSDFSLEEAYARTLQYKAREGDVLYALSTTGDSSGIIRAIDTARQNFMIVVGMTGLRAGKMEGRCDYLLKIPSSEVPRIQEAHMMIGHIICELVERRIFGSGDRNVN